MKKHLLALVLILAAVLRLLYLADIWSTPIANVPIIDSEYYHEQAKSSASGQGGVEGVFFMSPLYPWVLGFLYRLFGSDVHVGLIFQSLAGVLIVYLIYLLGKRWFREEVGLLSALLAACYRPFVYYEGALLTATLILMLDAFVLLLLISPRRTNLKDLAAGILLGLSALARPNVLLFASLLILYLLFASRRHGLLRPALVLLGIALVLVPVAYRNYRVGGEWVLTTAGAGMNFFAGNNPSAEGIYWEAPFLRSAEPEHEEEDYRLEASRRLGKELNVAEASSYWMNQGLDFIVRRPTPYLQLLAKKLFLFFHRTEIPNNLSIYAAQDFSNVLRWVPFSFGLLAPIGLAFWFLCLPKSNLQIAYLYGLSYLLATLLFFAASEYRLPILLVLLPLTAAGFLCVWEHVRRARWKPLTSLVLLAVLFALPVNMSTSFTRSLQSPRMDYFNLGSVLQKQNRNAEAAAMFTRALSIDPTFTEAHRALGESYHAMKQHDKAAEEFKRAGLDARQELLILDADELLEEAERQAYVGDYTGALKSYEQGIALHPDPPAYAYFNMASLNLHFGDTTRAMDELNLAHDIAPDDPRAPYTLGLINENRHEWQSARDHFLTALKLAPVFHPARIHAALACIELADTSEAARLIEPIIGQELGSDELDGLLNDITRRVGF